MDSKANRRAYLCTAALVAVFGWNSPVRSDEGTKVPSRERVALLHRHYPDLIYSVTNNTARLMNNRTMVIDDGDRKSHLQKRRGDGDIEDQLAQIYPVGRCFKGRLKHFDPGLVRNAAFFRNAYGSTRHYV